MQPKFVHLRLHSEYSIVDGIVRIDDAVAAAAADGMPALALTDLSNLFGMVKFYQAARGQGLKPLIGCDVWLSNETDRDKPYRPSVLRHGNEIIRFGQHLGGHHSTPRLLLGVLDDEIVILGPHVQNFHLVSGARLRSEKNSHDHM